jgi:hypothetical protein
VRHLAIQGCGRLAAATWGSFAAAGEPAAPGAADGELNCGRIGTMRARCCLGSAAVGGALGEQRRGCLGDRLDGLGFLVELQKLCRVEDGFALFIAHWNSSLKLRLSFMRVIEAAGNDRWPSSDGLVGRGPFDGARPHRLLVSVRPRTS